MDLDNLSNWEGIFTEICIPLSIVIRASQILLLRGIECSLWQLKMQNVFGRYNSPH